MNEDEISRRIDAACQEVAMKIELARINASYDTDIIEKLVDIWTTLHAARELYEELESKLGLIDNYQI